MESKRAHIENKKTPQLVLVQKSKESDEEIIERVKSGDNDAYRIIVRKYRSTVAGVIRNMLGASSEVEDVGQEVFIRFFKSLSNFRYESSVSTYLTRIAINLSLNAIKRRSRNRKRHLDAEDFPEIPSYSRDPLEGADLKKDIEIALNELSEEHRLVVVLRLIQGFSTKETASALNVPIGTVLSRLSRAQHKLRNSLTHYSE